MKEQLTIHEKANDHVRKVEEDFVIDTVKETCRARKAADGCGCRNCVNHLRTMEEICEDEAYRLTNVPVIDHEEVLLADYAMLRFLEERKKKRGNRE